MKKLILGIILLVGALIIVLYFNNVLATEEPTVATYDGASIRTDDPVGLRFKGHVEGDFGEGAKYGFLMSKGSYTKVEMLQNQTAGKTASVEGDETVGGDYFVSIINIPQSGYLQDITVLAYVDVGGNKTYATTSCTRNIYEVAITTAANGGRVDDGIVDNVLDYIEGNYKSYRVDGLGNIILDSPIYETDPAVLYNDFAVDWNTVNPEKSLELDLNGEYLQNAIKTSLKAEYEFDENCALAKFFSDSIYGPKWTWLLKLLEVGPMNDYFRQVNRLTGEADVIYGSTWNCGYRIIARLGAFFSQSHYNPYGSIEFNAVDYNRSLYGLISLGYNEVKNDQVYIDAANVTLVKIGTEISLINFPNKTGYTKKYFDGDRNLNIGDNITVSSSNNLYSRKYIPINYDVTYYDGVNLLNTLNPTTYTVEDNYNLPIYEKDGYVFDGWYDNADLLGDPITEIEKGSIGDKIYYAKTHELVYASVQVTYDLNGGKWDGSAFSSMTPSTTMSITYRNYSMGNGSEEKLNISTDRKNYKNFYKIFLLYDNDLHVYIVTRYKEEGTQIDALGGVPGNIVLVAHANCTDQDIYDFFITNGSSAYEGMYVVIDGDLNSIPSSNPGAADGMFPVKFYASNVLTNGFTTDLTVPVTLVTPVRDGYTFVGWKSSLDDQVITEYPGYLSDPGDITYTAQWVEK